MNLSQMDQGLLIAYIISAVILAGIFIFVYPSLKGSKKSSTVYHKIKGK